jgi:class 3 adenylate cyclase/HAMP domain-containing protein
MNIRAKTNFIVLPLIIAPLLLTAIFSSFSARDGITGVATEFLKFKTEQLRNYSDSQWALLVENRLSENDVYLSVSKSAVESFARSLIRSDTEIIFAVDKEGEVTMGTRDIALDGEEAEMIKQMVREQAGGWRHIRLDGVARVAQVSVFEPFGWSIFVTEEEETFYRSVNGIIWQTGLILSIALAISVVLLFVFSGYLTRPLRSIVRAMENVMATNDLSKRVAVLYRDEIGRLGHTFNLMTTELENAYDQIKSFAFKAVIAKSKETKIRNIFQKYVPKTVIEQFFANPESMLVGENRVLAVLFSDIRGFTPIAERLRPAEIVESLNQYFALMVDVILNHNGVVDKYIGDAIMAFFGAPVRHKDDALQSVYSGLAMIETLKDFNRWQAKKGRPDFRIGVGINYGPVTVGNIGSEKKMDYTVIGDMVNLASRIEGLTKQYREPILISESVYKKTSKDLHCRLIDRVVVKGKTQGVRIYTARKTLNSDKKEAWKLHQVGLDLYYGRQFREAAECFTEVKETLVDDRCSDMFLERCRLYMKSPPPEDWDGLVEITEK